MVTYSDIATRVARDQLEVFGGFHPGPNDGAPAGCGTLLLLGPREPGFWHTLLSAPEATESQSHDASSLTPDLDTMDRWSARVIGEIAADLGGRAVFPFGGPPSYPFFAWATKSGRAWASPVTLLVHDVAGLMVSYRGALALPFHVDLPTHPDARPCARCDQPCVTACPAAALTAADYDTGACHAALDTPAGAGCMTQGCAVRRACPISQAYGRDPAQSAYHMRAFHP